MYFLQTVFTVLLLVTALSVDAFVASLAYGANNIRVTAASAVTINGICSAFLGLSLGAGRLLGQLLTPASAKAVSCGILLLLGVIKLFDCAVKGWIAKRRQARRHFQFSFSGLRVVLSIYADPMAADRDHSRSLSISESVFLAVAMSLDGMVAGFGAAVYERSIGTTVLLSFVVGMLAVTGGCLIGHRMAGRLKWDISWMGGALFLLLAGLRLR